MLGKSKTHYQEISHTDAFDMALFLQVGFNPRYVGGENTALVFLTLLFFMSDSCAD